MKKQLLGLGLIIAALAFFGCSTMNPNLADLQNQVKQKDQEIKTLQATNSDNEQQLKDYQARLNEQPQDTQDVEMKAKNSGPVGELLPTGAKTGECYARVFVPPVYRTVSEQVLKTEASERVEIIPARSEWTEERIIVKEASERLELIPAEYAWVEEKVMVDSSSTRMEGIPARYEWVEEKIQVAPAHTTWKKGHGLIEKVDNTTGEIMCLVEVPAKYRTIKKRVLREAAKTNEVEIPASYKIMKKKVMVKPPTQRKIEIPAEYATVKVHKMVSPPQEKRISIPAEYQTVTRKEQVSEGQMEWRRVLCETNVRPDLVSEIQSALLSAGHNPGPIDGVYGHHTQTAVNAYQREKGLATGGLTYDTIQKLGVKL